MASLLPGPKRKQAEALTQNVLWLAKTFGVERIGFLTLTFSDAVRSQPEASRRWNSLLNVFRNRYRCGVTVRERHKSGAIHFHSVLVLRSDIRSGIDFAKAFPKTGRGDYRSAPSSLREEWRWLRETLPAHRFGRHQLQPVKSTAEGVARYLGKYIVKTWESRVPDDSGVRLVSYWGRWSVSEKKAAAVHLGPQDSLGALRGQKLGENVASKSRPCAG